MVLVRLIRPGNVIMVFASVWIGSILEAGFGDGVLLASSSAIALAALSAALVAGGGNVLNDYFDIDADRVNRPERALPSGQLSPSFALVYGILVMTIGVALGFVVSVLHGVIAGLCSATLILYNRHLKVRGIAGNLTVSLVAGATLIYGGLVVGDARMALTGAVFAFSLTLAREIVKDMQDVDGDTSIQSRSLPLVYGEKTAGRVAIGVIMVTIIATPLPFLYGDFGGLFLLLMIVVNIILLRAVSYLQGSVEAGKTSALLKISMLCGMIGLVLGRIGE